MFRLRLYEKADRKHTLALFGYGSLRMCGPAEKIKNCEIGSGGWLCYTESKSF